MFQRRRRRHREEEVWARLVEGFGLCCFSENSMNIVTAHGINQETIDEHLLLYAVQVPKQSGFKSMVH